MPTTGSIVTGTVRQDDTYVYASINIEGIEFNCSTPLMDDNGKAKTKAVLKDELAADAKRQLELQSSASQKVTGITGNITL